MDPTTSPKIWHFLVQATAGFLTVSHLNQPLATPASFNLLAYDLLTRPRFVLSYLLFFFGFTRDGSVFIRCFVSGSLQQIEWSSCTCCGKICLSSTRDFPNARHIKQFHYFTLMTSRVSFHHMKRNRVTTARLAAQSSLNLLFSVTNQFVPRTM